MPLTGKNLSQSQISLGLALEYKLACTTSFECWKHRNSLTKVILQSALSASLILFTNSKPRRQPRDTRLKTNSIKNKSKWGRDPERSVFYVFVDADEPGWEDIDRVSCRAAVCFEWTSCSLLFLVSQCPLSGQGLPKWRTGAASLRCTDWQSMLLRGLLFKGYQQALG